MASRTTLFDQLATGPEASITGRRRRDRYGGFLKQKIVNPVKGFITAAWRRYQRADTRQKFVIWSMITAQIFFLSMLAIITPKRVFQYLQEFSDWLRDQGSFGALLLFLVMVTCSHPPLFGVASTLTLIGFTFGLWPGALIASAGSMCGAALAFLSIRTFFLKWMKAFGSGRSDKWKAFSDVIKQKGILLIIMIRWSPVPWSLSNGMFASIETVSFGQFMLATLLIQPRLMIPVFIGSRLDSLTEPSGNHDKVSKFVNIAAIISGIAVSMSTGYVIYRATLRQMEHMKATGEIDSSEIDDAEDVFERNALLGDFSGSESDDEERVRLGGVLERGDSKGSHNPRGIQSGQIRRDDDDV